jgi:hypothetical protein
MLTLLAIVALTTLPLVLLEVMRLQEYDENGRRRV